MGIFERIQSAVEGAIPVEDDLDMGDSNRVKNLPDPEDDNDAIREGDAPVQSVNGETGEVEVDTTVPDDTDTADGYVSNNVGTVVQTDDNEETDTKAIYAPVDRVVGEVFGDTTEASVDVTALYDGSDGGSVSWGNGDYDDDQKTVTVDPPSPVEIEVNFNGSATTAAGVRAKPDILTPDNHSHPI